MSITHTAHSLVSSVGVEEQRAATMDAYQGGHDEKDNGSKDSTWAGHEKKGGVGEGKGGESQSRFPPKRGQVVLKCLCKIAGAVAHGDCCKKKGSCKINPQMKGE